MDDAEELKKDGAKIDTVAHVDYSQCLGVATNPDFAELESRKEASDQIVEHLKDPDVKIVGMYGMGGAGKTTLAEKIGVQLYEDGTFKYVVLSVVSNQQKQDPIYAIQKQIADLLKIKLQETDGLKARAKQLREQLVRKDKLLIILDDIWHRLELRDVGIPVDSSSPEELKVLITSRGLNVMNEMNSKHNVPLDFLTPGDAWKLFDRMAGGVDQDSDHYPTALDVVKQCGGIPVLLVTIARALRNRDWETWKEALSQLESFDGDDFVEDAYKRIEVSYQFLKNDEMRSLFLLCSQLDPHSIPIEDLLRYTIGLGLFKGRKKLKEVSYRLSKYLSDLIGFCLLQDGNANGTVRMHDVVYKCAVFVASRDHHTFIVSDEWPPAEQLEQLTAISLPYCHLPLLDDDQIPAVLFDNPNLESFLMYGEKYQPKLRIPDNVFKQMKRLKLLVSRRMCLSWLPTSLKDLVELQTLCLDYCELDDIAMIGLLLKLQVLSLKGSNVAHLPTEIGNLARLKVLDLSECYHLKVIAPGVLSKLTLLEDLRIESYSNHVWEQEGCSSNGTKTASLEELRKLQNLNNLQINIDDGKMYPKDLIFVNLETFRIGIKCRAPTLFRSSKSLGLDLDNARADQLDQGIKVLMARAENLSLRNIKGFTSLCELINLESFPHLKHLRVAGIAEIPYIAQQSSYVVFPKLESLGLHHLEKLERICVAQPFENLSVLEVASCDRLKNVFSSHLERGFMCLTELNVRRCKGMQTIVSRESENRSVDDQDQDDKDIEFTQLRSLTLENLPSLTRFYCNLEPTVEENYEGPTPAFLLNKMIMFPRLEELTLISMSAGKIWEGQLAVESFQSLTRLEVKSCHKLSYLFSSLMVENLGQLKKLTVCRCDSVEEIVAVGGEEMTEEKLLLFPKLEMLVLSRLKKLKKFCHANLLQCPSLKTLEVEDCKELMTFITNDANTGDLETINSSILFDEKVVFPNLEKLTLKKLDQFKMIWGNELHPDALSKLDTLVIRHCASLESVYPAYLSLALQQLEVLKLGSCERMRGIVSWKEAEAIDCSPGFVFSKLRFLQLEDLPRLEKFYLGPDISDWPCLKRFTLLKCHKTDMQHDGTFAKIMLPRLEELKLLLMSAGKIWEGQVAVESFQSLTSLKVMSCHKLSSLFSSLMVEKLGQLKVLTVGDCDSVEEIVAVGGEEMTEEKLLLFPKLETLYLFSLKKLKKFCHANLLECPSLKTLLVQDCKELMTFITNDANAGDLEAINSSILFDEKVVFPNLEKLTLANVDQFKMIWVNELHPDSLSKLKHLEIHFCALLESVFPAYLSLALQQLAVLKLGSCERMRGIVSWKEAEAMDCSPGFVFSKLNYLRLEDLPRLEKFYLEPDIHISDWPCLKELAVRNCHKTDMQQFAKIVPILDYYYFVRDHLSVRYKNSDGDGELYIHCPELFGGGSQVFPVALLQGFQHLKKLVVERSNLKQVLFRSDLQLINPGDDEDTVAKILARIQSLELTGLREMTYIWSEHSPLDQIVHNLKSLYVKECDSLISLAPSTALFQNLKDLTLYRCQKLMKLFTFSTARSLINLVEMSVIECESLTEIIGNADIKDEDEDAIEDNDIVFGILKELRLVALTSLTSFSSAHNCSFKFPLLESVTVKECPNMVFFSPGILTAPKLTRVMEEEYEKELWRWEGDLNSTIRQWHRELMTNQDTKELHSTNMEEDCLQQK